MVRWALAGVVLFLAVVGSSAATPSPALVLHDGQTRYLLPRESSTGALVRCVVNGKHLDVRLPNSPAAGVSSGSDTVGQGGAAISVARRPNGATEVRCGTATAGGGFFGRSPNPYVIGQNGLALIRGQNQLSALDRIYGRARTTTSTKPCRVAWPSIGLVATFAADRCSANSVLVGAVVDSPRWSSLSGVQVGDSLAKLVWEAQSAKPLPHGRWLLASGGASHHAKLVAVTSAGAVVRLVLTGS